MDDWNKTPEGEENTEGFTGDGLQENDARSESYGAWEEDGFTRDEAGEADPFYGPAADDDYAVDTSPAHQADEDDFVIGKGFRLEEEPAAPRPRTQGDGRGKKKKKKKRRGCLGSIIWILVILIIAGGLATGVIMAGADLLGDRKSVV